MSFRMATLFALVACAACLGGTAAQSQGYMAALQKNSNHTLMVNMVKSNKFYANLLSKATTSMTIFAPTDVAFNKMMAQYKISAAAAMQNKNLLHNVLTYHVIMGKTVMSSSLKHGTSLGTMKSGMALTVTTNTQKKQIWINSVGSKALVVKRDQKVYNPQVKTNSPVIGVIHDIDAVLLPTKDVMSLF